MASAAQASKDAKAAGKSKVEQVAMAAQAAADTARHEGLLPHQPQEPVRSVTLQWATMWVLPLRRTDSLQQLLLQLLPKQLH